MANIYSYYLGDRNMLVTMEAYWCHVQKIGIS